MTIHKLWFVPPGPEGRRLCKVTATRVTWQGEDFLVGGGDVTPEGKVLTDAPPDVVAWLERCVAMHRKGYGLLLEGGKRLVRTGGADPERLGWLWKLWRVSNEQ